jgi:hypothetical protein
LKNRFPTIRYAKIKEGVFVGPLIKHFIQDLKFEVQLSEVEKVAWKSLKKSLPIIGKSLSDMLVDPVQSNKAMGCNMSSLRLSVRLLPRKPQGSER